MPIHTATLALPTGALVDHKIMCSFGYRLDQLAHHFGVIAAAVEEDDNLATWRNSEGAAIATVNVFESPGSICSVMSLSGSHAFNRWHLDSQFRATLPK
jgi:hypothetical protein